MEHANLATTDQTRGSSKPICSDRCRLAASSSARARRPASVKKCPGYAAGHGIQGRCILDAAIMRCDNKAPTSKDGTNYSVAKVWGARGRKFAGFEV